MSPSSGSELILIVDDDTDLAETLGEVLASEGYAIELASDGREALRRLREHGRSSLVILDLMMPVMNGWEFRAEQLRDPGLATIPVVAFSGDGNVEQKGASIGAVAYLRKPVGVEELLTLVRRVCRSRGGA